MPFTTQTSSITSAGPCASPVFTPSNSSSSSRRSSVDTTATTTTSSSSTYPYPREEPCTRPTYPPGLGFTPLPEQNSKAGEDNTILPAHVQARRKALVGLGIFLNGHTYPVAPQVNKIEVEYQSQSPPLLPFRRSSSVREKRRLEAHTENPDSFTHSGSPGKVATPQAPQIPSSLWEDDRPVSRMASFFAQRQQRPRVGLGFDCFPVESHTLLPTRSLRHINQTSIRIHQSLPQPQDNGPQFEYPNLFSPKMQQEAMYLLPPHLLSPEVMLGTDGFVADNDEMIYQTPGSAYRW